MIPESALSNKGLGRRGSVLPVVLVVIVLGVVGYFGWRAIREQREAKRREVEKYNQEQEDLRSRERDEALEADEEERRKKLELERQERKEREEENALGALAREIPREKAVPEAEILRKEEAQRKAVWAQIEEARKKSGAEPRRGFAGINFGEPIASGAPVKWGTALEGSAGDSVSARGVAFAVYGPKLSKPIFSLGATPLVWVTPRERRPYRIEFSRPLAPKSATKHDPETTNIVAWLQRNLRCDPFVPRPCEPGRAGCEFVFPMGVTTWTVGEYDGVLRFAVEREDIREEARAETETLRQQLSVVSADGERLDSKRYPNGGVDLKKYRGLRFKDGTPPSFCGVVFGSSPAENTTIQVPQNGAKGFFLDYRMAKCPPFRGFVYGRADIDSERGGVYAVHLSSEGGVYGQDDKDYYESVKAALSEHYKAKPSEEAGDGEFPKLTYQIGDLTVMFGSDPRGGFFLDAVNGALAALTNTPPPVAAKPRKR